MGGLRKIVGAAAHGLLEPLRFLEELVARGSSSLINYMITEYDIVHIFKKASSNRPPNYGMAVEGLEGDNRMRDSYRGIHFSSRDLNQVIGMIIQNTSPFTTPTIKYGMPSDVARSLGMECFPGLYSPPDPSDIETIDVCLLGKQPLKEAPSSD